MTLPIHVINNQEYYRREDVNRYIEKLNLERKALLANKTAVIEMLKQELEKAKK